jgi:hypothetical protein
MTRKQLLEVKITLLHTRNMILRRREEVQRMLTDTEAELRKTEEKEVVQ